jgi:hypothetical protein
MKIDILDAPEERQMSLVCVALPWSTAETYFYWDRSVTLIEPQSHGRKDSSGEC